MTETITSTTVPSTAPKLYFGVITSAVEPCMGYQEDLTQPLTPVSKGLPKGTFQLGASSSQLTITFIYDGTSYILPPSNSPDRGPVLSLGPEHTMKVGASALESPVVEPIHVYVSDGGVDPDLVASPLEPISMPSRPGVITATPILVGTSPTRTRP